METMRVIARHQTYARPGQALVIVALLFTVLMGMAALAIDIGNLALQQRNLRGIAESAAMIGAQYFDGRDEANPIIHSDGKAAAEAYLAASPRNFACPGPDCMVTRGVAAYDFPPTCTPSGTIYDPSCSYPNTGLEYHPSCPFLSGCQYQYIQVTLRRTVGFSFARVLGVQSQSVAVTATARTIRTGGGSRAAVIALDPAGGGVVISHPFEISFQPSTYRVTANVVSYRHLIASKSLAISDGAAYAATSITIRSGYTISPAYYQNDSTVSSRFPDPYQAFGVSFPNLSGYPPTSCPLTRRITTGTLSINPATEAAGRFVVEIDPLDPPGTPPPDILFLPGRYCSIAVGDVGAGRVRFPNGDYLIEDGLLFDTGSRVLMQNSGPSLAPSDGAYFQILGGTTNPQYRGVRSTSTALFDLKGHPNRRDVLFHIPASISRSDDIFISLNNTIPSQVIGSIYAPNHAVIVRGNNCTSPPCFSRVTGGWNPNTGSRLTQRGGRVVAREVVLWVDTDAASSWTAWGIDYPPTNEGYEPMPILVPNSP